MEPSPITRYLPRFLTLYLVIGSALVVLYAVVRIGGAFAMVTPGLLALVVGQNFVRDEHRLPTDAERRLFTVLAAAGVLALTALMGAAATIAHAVFRSESVGSGLEQLSGAGPMALVSGAVLFAAMNALLIYLLLGIAARQEWRNRGD